MKELKIKKLKIGKGNKPEITYDEIVTDEENNVVVNEISLKGGNAIHEDLKNALAKLDFHLAVICEQTEGKSKSVKKGGEIVDSVPFIHVTGYSIGGDESDSEGVTLIGRRNLRSGKVLNLVAPFNMFDSELNDYPHLSDLMFDVELASRETELYIGGKCTPPAQMEMNFSGTGVDEEGN